MQEWAWGTTSQLALRGAGWAPCRDSSWPLWEGRSEGFSKGHSESWSLQPGASARVSKGGCFWLQDGVPGAGAGTV